MYEKEWREIDKENSRYVRIDTIYEMRKMIKQNYRVIFIDLDKTTGFCTLLFDLEQKQKSINERFNYGSGVEVEKIKNIVQANTYLEFDCTIVDVGVDKVRLKNGQYKNFFYVKFLFDEGYKSAKKYWC